MNIKQQMKIRRSWRGTAGSKWYLDLRDAAGKRVRRFFASKDQAQAWGEVFVTKANNEGIASALGVSDADRVLAARATELLKPYGANVLDAAKHYADYLERLNKTETVQEAVDALLTAKERDEVSDRYLSDLRSRLNRFVETFGEKGIAVVATRDIDDWLRGLNLGAQSRINYRRVLHTLWQFCIGRQTARENPVQLTAKPKARGNEIQIYSPKELSKLLNGAPADYIPTVALGAFAGLRTAEIERLEWSDIDFSSGFITVGSAKAKTRSRRLIPIAENLASWLAPFTERTGEIWQGSEKERRAARKAAVKNSGVAWKDNALRHSFISYRLAETQDAAKVSLEAGNSPSIVFKHYRELVKPKDAATWFSIVPKTPANVVSIKKSR